MDILESGTTQVLWDGEVGEKFKPSRGVRQGDPVSPYLFVLCMERLSQAIKLEVDKGKWKPITVGKNGTKVSHLFFADDLILFAEASFGQVQIINQVLSSFCRFSGQAISKDKTLMYCSPNIEAEKARLLSSSLEVHLVNDLGKYLGTPIVHGRVTKATYKEVVERVQQRAKLWNPHKISLAGRLTLCQSVLTAIPSYLMQSTALPKGTSNDIDKARRGFLWGAKQGERKVSLVNWDSVCQPKACGGLGIRKLRDVNISLLMKFVWGILSGNNSLWCRVFKDKYGIKEGEIVYDVRRSKASHLWRQIAASWDVGLKCLKWNLGDGRTVRFWRDTWAVEDRPLLELAVVHIPAELLDLKVIEFVDSNGDWRWELFSIYLPEEVWRQIGAIPPPTSTQGCDSLIWKNSKSGKFSTAAAYKLLCSDLWQPKERKWECVWRWRGPERIRTFLWLLMRGALLTNEERKRRHLTEDSCCHLCGEMESTWHVFRDCYRSKELWWRINCKLETPFWTERNIEKWLETNLNSISLQDHVPWPLWFGITCWKLWRMRNEEVMAGHAARGRDTFHEIQAMTKEVQWINNEFGTQSKTLKYNNPKFRWQPPPMQWIKINTDGSMRSSLNRATAGGSLRNCKGEWLSGFVINIGSCSPLEAELWGAFKGLEIAWNQGYRRVILETDSSEAIDIITKEFMDQ